MSPRDEIAPARCELELAPEAESAGRARRFVERALTSWERVDLIEITVLLANELVTNSVLHAGTHIHLELAKVPAGVRVQVSDHDAAPVSPRLARLDSENGRGLALIEGISDNWGIERGRAGKTVWFEIAQ